jgi:hypothetical protein
VRRPIAEPTILADAAKALTKRKRVLLFCAVSSTDWDRAGIPGTTGMIFSAGFGKD